MSHRRYGGLLGLALLLAAVAGVFLGLEMREELALGPEGTVTGAILASHHPLHARPAVETASDAQCLACHASVLEARPRAVSPAGIPASSRRAAYQETPTYQGEQESFHRRHLVTPLARSLMNLSCTTCHQGHDPREEAPGSSATAAPQGAAGFTLRKQVDVEQTCLKCHGRMNHEIMGLPAPWPESRELFGNSCLTCHASIRTVRHRVNYLKPAAIEAKAAKEADICYGCHGGRAWYRLSYPYPRHPWPGAGEAIPAWAQGRPQHSEPRFLEAQ